MAATDLFNLDFLFNSAAVRRLRQRGRGRAQRRELYAAVDVVAALGARDAAGTWNELREREPELVAAAARPAAPFLDEAGRIDWLDREGVLRVAMRMDAPRAREVREWLVQAGGRWIEEQENPELAILRTARLYQQRGRPRQWIEKRMRGMAARHELTAEWRRRGLVHSEQYRELTNALMRAAFGLDVNEYRRHKNLTRPGQNLRDAMSDLELVLTMLGETVAAALHRERGSTGFDDMLADAQEAGAIAAAARERIEQAGHRRIVEAGAFGAPASAAPRPTPPPSPSPASVRPHPGMEEPRAAEAGKVDPNLPAPQHSGEAG